MTLQLSLLCEATPRRKAQWERIFKLLASGGEWSLSEMQRYFQKNEIYYSETSISARLRELAHGKQPGWTITKRTENGRTYYYKAVRA
jgi:hypothetical protein